MPMRLALAVLLACLLPACSSSTAEPAPMAQFGDSLPPPTAAQLQPTRRVSDSSRYSFGSIDVLAISEGSEFVDGDGLTLFGKPLNYAILGATIADGQPVRLDVFGWYGSLAVGVADFEHGRWDWLAVGLSSGALIDIPPSALDEDGRFLVALVHASRHEWDSAPITSIAVVTDNDDAGDEDSPLWINEEGIISADGSSSGFLAQHGLAADEATAPQPVAYIYYAAPSFAGIDWTRPLEIRLDDGSDMWGIEYNIAGTQTDVAVRAMDVKGNLTPNTNYFSFYFPYSDEGPEDGLNAGGVWRFGDRVRLRWDDPEIDLGLAVLGPGIEGDPEFAWPDAPFAVSAENTVAGVAEEWVALLPGAPEGAYTVEVRSGSFPPPAVLGVLELRRANGTVETLVAEIDFSQFSGADVAYLFHRP